MSNIVTEPSYATGVDTLVTGMVMAHARQGNNPERVTSDIVDKFKYTTVFNMMKNLLSSDKGLGIVNGYTVLKDWARAVSSVSITSATPLSEVLLIVISSIISDNHPNLNSGDKQEIKNTFVSRCMNNFISPSNIGLLTTGFTSNTKGALGTYVRSSKNVFELYNYVLELEYLHAYIGDINAINDVINDASVKTRLQNIRKDNSTYYAQQIVSTCVQLIDFYIHYTLLMWLTESSSKGGLVQRTNDITGAFGSGSTADKATSIRNTATPFIARLIQVNAAFSQSSTASELLTHATEVKENINTLNTSLVDQNDNMSKLKRSLAVLMTIHDKNRQEYEASRMKKIMVFMAVVLYVAAMICLISFNIPGVDTMRKGMILIICNGILSLGIVLYDVYTAITVKNSL